MRRLIHIIRALAPNCRDAIRLQSDAMNRPLPFLQRLGLRIHLIFCVWCTRYGRQLLWLRKTTQELESEKDEAVLSHAAKARMQLAIRSEKIDKRD